MNLKILMITLLSLNITKIISMENTNTSLSKLPDLIPLIQMPELTPYCPLCAKTFTNPYSLKRHRKSSNLHQHNRYLLSQQQQQQCPSTQERPLHEPLLQLIKAADLIEMENGTSK